MTDDKIKILIVDDEQVVVDSLLKICEMEGYKTSFALSAEEGLALLKKENFDLILCDIMLPEMSGFEFLEELHAKKIDTPVIMTTGYSTVENAVKSLYEGAIDYVPKPFEVDEILSALSRGINYRKIKNIMEHAETSDIVYVGCPSKYYRLGVASWTHITAEGLATLGATDLFLKTVESFDSLKLMGVDEEIYQGSSCAWFTSEKGFVHDLLSPISGKIIERNENVLNNNSIIEKDPYFDGWLYKVIPSDIEYEMKNLISCSSDQL